MANSIKKYVFSASHTSNTAFPAPNFMTGRQSDIKVKVGKEELQSNQYSLGTNQGGSWEVKFNAGFLPNEGDSIRIYRQTNHTGRLVDFVDGSLLTSETLDLDSDQLFNIAIEAYDKGDEATIGSESFYYSQGTNPNDDITGNVDTGTLWYDTTNTPFQLKVWNGSEWQATAPARVTKKYGTTTSNGKTAVVSHPTNSSFSQFTDAAFNSDSSLYLNGVKLVQTTNIVNIPAGGDYTVDNGTVTFLDLSSASDILVSETFSGHFSSSVFDAETNAAASAATAGQSAAGAASSSQISSNHRLDAEDARDDAAKYASHPKNSTFSTHDNSATGQYSAKHYAETALDSATVAHASATSTTVQTVANDLSLGSNSLIKQVADDIDDVTAVAGKITEVESLAGKTSEMTTLTTGTALSDINTVAGKATEVGQVAAIDSEITDVALKLSEIDAVEAKLSDIEDVAEVAAQVSSVATAIPDITTVATEPYKSKIETVYTHRDTITDVGGEITKVTTVANDLNGANNIGTLADPTYKQQVTDVATQIGAVGTVSASINNNDISTVVSNVENIGTVAGISDDVTNLSKSTGDMSTLVSKLSQTTDLAGAVNDAQASATAAAGSASTATTQATAAAGSASTAATHAANLGSVAYQNLTAIAESKSVSAADVFVYDTSKDSDGGAWRNRTQGTSWYNEALNTSYRGATKKFPAVAVIVAENNNSNDSGTYGFVDIYDADDPAMPLWMRFRGDYDWATGQLLAVAGHINYAPIQAITMKDGKLYVASSNVTVSTASGLYEIDFIKDSAQFYSNEATTGRCRHNITQRNQPLGHDTSQSFSHRIVNHNVNDIAVTVLPNAPIDPDTGLPVPTIAVATDGGVSVIKDDGSVYDVGAPNFGFQSVEFRDNLLFTSNYASGGHTRIFEVDKINADWVLPLKLYEYAQPPYLTQKSTWSSGRKALPTRDNEFAQITNGNKLTLVGMDLQNVGGTTTGKFGDLAAYVSSSYNTGWMNGDIKLATLMDTTAETISAPELVTNGDFSNGTTGWTASGNASLSINSGALRITTVTGGQTAYATTPLSLEVGKTYKYSVDNINTQGTGGMYLYLGSSAGSGSNVNVNIMSQAGTTTGTFVATHATTILTLLSGSSNQTGQYKEFDNVSVVEAVPDRSVNNNGLNIVGNVTKSAVATGAELVGYGTSGSSNYLTEPYNADYNFGYGDFCIMTWAKHVGSDQSLFYRGTGNGFHESGGLYVWLNLHKLKFRAGGNRSFEVDAPISPMTSGQWHHYVVCRRDGVVYAYQDGVLFHSQNISVSNIDSSTHITKISSGYYANNNV